MGIAGVASVGLRLGAGLAPVGGAAQCPAVAALVAAGLALLFLAWRLGKRSRSRGCAADYTSSRR
jgi:hypothetical protein